MNKKIFYLLITGLMITSSCSDSFLDSEPITLVTDGNFYKTKADAEVAIVGCYAGIQEMYASGMAFPVASVVLSDNTFGGTGNNDGLGYQMVDEFDLSRSTGDVNMFDGNWIAYYKALYRINVLLQKMDQIDWEEDDAYRTSIESQARFLRAFIYFDMVRLWERVPLLTEPLNGNIPQSEPEDIYTVIAEDLVFAASNGGTSVEPGRINSFAAKALLARVYLFYTGYYSATDLVGVVSQSDVLSGLEDIITSGNYGLIPDFKDLWPASSSTVNSSNDGLTSTYAGKDNMETLFAVKYNITSDYNGNTDSNHWLVMMGLRVQSFSPYGRGWGACTVSPDFHAAFDPDDNRRDASIIDISGEGLDFDTGDQREFTGFTNKKYTPLSNPDGQDLAEANEGVSFQISQFQDYVVIRYADVLLMAAELGSSNAQTYFDQVRTRAGLSSRTVSQANILEERRFEFALEGIRYWDLLRQGVAVAAATIAESTTVQNGGVSVVKTIDESNVIKTRGFQMIPQNQITRSNGVLTQNAGWL